MQEHISAPPNVAAIHSRSNGLTLIVANDENGAMIKRRNFLISASSMTGLAAVGMPLPATPAATKTVNRVAVIGAGIVGAAIAYNLAKRGCEVLVIEKTGPAAQASGNTFAWVNAAYVNQSSYYMLRRNSLLEYHLLAEDIDIPLRWGGSLEWFSSSDKESQLIRDVEGFQTATGSPTRMIDAREATSIEPNLVVGGDRKLAYSSNDGTVDAPATTRALLKQARKFGARLIMPATVIGLDNLRDEIRVKTTVDNFCVDVTVVAAGVGTTDIAAMIGDRVNTSQRATPGVIITTAPMQAILNCVLYPPNVHMHQQSDGRLILGEKAGLPSTVQHAAHLKGRPNSYPDKAIARHHAGRILKMAEKYVPELASARIERVGIGWRPMPRDGFPLMGYSKLKPGVYYAAMHSGVTLAPIVGRLAALEILDRVRVVLLGDFRPERFHRDST